MNANQEPADNPPKTEISLRKKDREWLENVLTGHAVVSRPLAERLVDWLDTMEVTGTLEDGGRVSFQLSQVSHMTSHRPHPNAGEKAPRTGTLPAVIHFKNGDFVTMRDSFDVWYGRLEEARHRAFKALSDPLEIKQ